jgi:transposase-like protein
VLGVFARSSGEIHLEVTHSSSRAAIQPLVEACTSKGCTVNTDEWVAYDKLPEGGRKRVKVKHSKPNCEYARDDDADGVREVHCNSIEGVWTGLRNFLRTFRGVSKKYLAQYVAMFEWSHNIKKATAEFIRALLGCTTIKGT